MTFFNPIVDLTRSDYMLKDLSNIDQSQLEAIFGGVELEQPDSGKFWTFAQGFAPADLGGDVKINRVERLFVGAARVNSGDFRDTSTVKGATVKDPIEVFEAARSHPYAFRTSWATVSAGSTVGGIGVLGYADSGDIDLNGFQLGIGVCGESINSNTVNQQLVTGIYGVAWRLPGAGVGVGCGTVGAEFDVVNEGNSVPIAPQNLFPTTGFTTGLQVMSGGASPTAQTASAGIAVGNNGAKWLAGLVFGQNAIAGVTLDGVTGYATGGYGSAIRFGNFQGLEWWHGADPTPNFKIYGAGLTNANAMMIRHDDSGIHFRNGADSQELFTMLFTSTNVTSTLRLAPGYGTTPTTVSASAGDLLIQGGAGGGRVRIGQAADYVATAGASAGEYPTFTKPDGTVRKIALLSN